MLSGNKDAVIFSLFDIYGRGSSYINDILSNYENCDIFVGVNSQGDTNILKYPQNENIYYHIADPKNIVNSDVTGYQIGIKKLLETKKEYRYVYFLHSKGASYNNYNYNIVKRDYFDQFISNKNKIEEVLKDEKIGLWCLVGRFNFTNTSNVTDEQRHKYFDLEKFIYPNRFSHNLIGYETLMTFYCIKFHLLNRFFRECKNNDLLEKNIENELGYNRYFFEHVFPNFVERYGYFPYIKYFWGDGPHKYNRQKLSELIYNWSNGDCNIDSFYNEETPE